MTLEQVAERLLSADEVSRDWFSPSSFADQVGPVVRDLKELGDLKHVRGCPDSCIATYEYGAVPFKMTLTSDNRISGILFDFPVLFAASLDEAIETLVNVEGRVSVYVTRNGEEIGAHEADAPMAVGSAFKLYVLKALNQLIGAGKLEWDQTVALKEEWRSLPSGQLQDWPVGTPVTIASLAALMISVSDNTATDALIDLVTRNTIETLTPRNRPFLTTRDLFQLRQPGRENQALAYESARYDERAAILRELEGADAPSLAGFNTEPMLGLEWHFTTQELCETLSDLHEEGVLQINSGVVNEDDWNSVAYKGGSDYGVINFTTHMTAADGTQYCASATWNTEGGEGITVEEFGTLYNSLIHQLKQ